jgi:hypothetical protein
MISLNNIILFYDSSHLDYDLCINPHGVIPQNTRRVRVAMNWVYISKIAGYLQKIILYSCYTPLATTYMNSS